MRSIDFNTLAGLALAAIAIAGGQLLEGAEMGSLLQLTAFLIVVGGTLGAVLVQSPVRIFLEGVGMAKWAVLPPPMRPQRLIEEITEWSHAARREGLLSLEHHVRDAADPFVKKGLQLVIDGADPDKLREALQIEITSYGDSRSRAARVWEAAGGYSPTLGILGAVLGLIHVMENLSDPSKLGSGIAVAFVATVYGVGLANLVYLPIAAKLKLLISEQVLVREMVLDGLVGLAQGDNPRVIESRMQGYLS